MRQPFRPARSVRFPLCFTLLTLGVTGYARAYAAPGQPTEAAVLVDLEQRAAAAEPRERPYLYSELLHDWTELAGREMTAGNDADAVMCLQHADADAAQLKSTLAVNSKRLKNAELLLEHTARHLSDMVRVAGMEEHDAMQAVLKHMNSIHDDLLAQIFSH